MTGRSRIRTVIEQARLAELGRQRTEADIAMRRHAKGCPQCSRGMSVTGKYCDDGYSLAMVRARTRFAWDHRFDHSAAPGEQITLF
jgi:hypothetical protein